MNHQRRRKGPRSFLSDRRGNFAVITALAAVPVIFTIGGALDFNMFYANRVRVQNAADAAALAAAKQFNTDPDSGRLESFARDYFAANAGELFRSSTELHYEGVSFNEHNVRELAISVDYSYRPMFLPLMAGVFEGMGDSFSEVRSVIAIGNTTLEVALVLDTSGSMNDSPSGGGSSKIETLREVAETAVDSLLQNSGVSGLEKPSQVSIVPFAGAVNVGADHLRAAWMDPKGLSPIHHENLDWASYNWSSDTTKTVNQISRNLGTTEKGPWVLKSNPAVHLTRQYIYENMREQSVSFDFTRCPTAMTATTTTSSVTCTWTNRNPGSFAMTVSRQTGAFRNCNLGSDPTCHPPYTLTPTGTTPLFPFAGCVEARPGIYALTDDTPTESNPSTLFVPYFAPDEYDIHSQVSFGNNWLNDRGWERNSYVNYDTNRWANGENVGWLAPTGIYALRDHRGSRSENDMRSSQQDVRKYLMRPTKVLGRSKPGTNNAGSPSYICESAPILPLTDNAAAAIAHIRSLDASGATNVEEGVGWGWRTLSPNEPFTGGRARGEEDNIKAIILMTDGANTYYANDTLNKSGYGAYGYAAQGRIFENTTVPSGTYTNANFSRAMNQRTAQICENARNDGRVPVTNARGEPRMVDGRQVTRDGVIIYTIAFDIPRSDQATVFPLLKGCASSYLDDQRAGRARDLERTYFYEASSNEKLRQAFADIVASLSSLRIAR
ncbi:TadE/TadG family type IV pilus assembly protein [Aureimonas populi]|uniref:Pilus assembly protein TadG-related protein n=1 Tax=Aureimonas populi TaxID=1701758 RepID=A0ABW5CJL2_9HYPH|nr:pilus assembly protein TadG-related protein [Aureimonas populi]